jgi:hypothetical protein
MPFLTIFSTPKPFTDPHIAIIQRNAIRSWLALGDEIEVLLIGDEPGLSETAAELGVRHLTDVACNQWGTPLISAIFSLARQHGSGELLAYVNADIIFLPDLLEAARRLHDQSDPFLMIGQRWDLDVVDPLDFGSGWEARLVADVDQRGSLHAPAGSDYFVFPRTVFTAIPDFAVGRAGWDNWMIYHARDQGWLTVDATPAVRIIHQNHSYSHLPEGQAHYNLAESDKNRALAGGKTRMYIVLDATRTLQDGELRKPPLTIERTLRQIELAITPRQGERRGLRLFFIRRLRRMRKFFSKRIYST